MVFEEFTLLVALMAVIYAIIARYIQNRLIDRSEMEGIQAESKKLNEEFKKAQESKNQKKIEEVMQKQMELLPKMNKMMFAQFKPMLIILCIFFGFMWIVGQVDPFVKDDMQITMADDGAGCDSTAGDGIYSACHTLDSSNYGKWVFTAKALKANGEIGHKSMYFLYNVAEISDKFVEGPAGEQIDISTDKEYYVDGETVHLYAQSANADSFTASLNSGTSFYVDLPVQIPLINVQRIQQPNWWFILVSIIMSLTMSITKINIGKKQK